MNISQIAQYFGNNLWYGEQKREGAPVYFADLAALVLPDQSRTWGTDISPWDGNVRLETTANKGASFVFVKGIDGTLQARYFVENRQRAINAGLINGAYGWLYRNVNVSCVAQAQAYDTLLNKYPVDLPAVIDFEPTKWGGVASNPTYADLRLWATEWLRLGNRKPILYSAAYYMDSFGPMPSDLRDMFEGLWVANYGALSPAMPMGWGAGNWLFHQFASAGDASILSPNDVGKKEVDLNYAISAQKLYELADLVPPPPSGGTTMNGKIIATALNIRQGAGANYLDIGDLLNGDLVTASESLGGWWHLTDATRNGAPVATSDGRLVRDRFDCWISGTYVQELPPTGPVVTFDPFDMVYYVDGEKRVQRFIPE